MQGSQTLLCSCVKTNTGSIFKYDIKVNLSPITYLHKTQYTDKISLVPRPGGARLLFTISFWNKME